MAIPVGTASIQIKPSFTGFSKTVSAEVRKSFPAINKEAGSLGKAMSDGFKSSSGEVVKTAQDISAKVAKAKDAQTKASKDYQAAADKEAKAVGDVRVAEQKLEEIRSKGNAKQSELIRAEEDLAEKRRKLATASDKAKEAQKRMDSTTDELSKSQKELEESTKKANAELEKVGKKKINVKGMFSGVHQELQKLQPAVDKVFSGLTKVGKWAGGAALAGGTAFMGAALTGGWNRLTNIENAQSSLKGLGYTAEEVEGIMTNVSGAVKGTAFGLDEAASASAGALGAGVKQGAELESYLTLVGDAATQSGTSFLDMANIFNKVQGSGKLTGETIAQMTDNGLYVVPILAEALGKTSDEIAKMASEGEISAEMFRDAMQNKIGGSAQNAGETMKGAMANARAAVSRFGANLLESVYPQVKEFFKGFIEFMGPLEEKAKVWGAEMGKALSTMATGLQGVIEVLATGQFSQKLQEAFGIGPDHPLVTFLTTAREMFLNLVSFIQTHVIPGIGAFFSFIGNNIGVIGALASVFLGVVVALKAYFTIVKAVEIAQGALHAVMRMSPWGWVLTAVMALVAGFVYLWNTNEGFRTAVTNIWNGLVSFFQAVWTNYLQPVFQAIGDFIMNTLVPAFLNFWHGTIVPVWNGICQVISNAWNNFIKPVLTAVWGYIRDVLAPAFVQFWTGTIIPVWNGIVSAISNAWNNYIWPTLKAVWNFITNTLAPVFKTLFENYVRTYFNAIKLFIAIAITAVVATLKIVWAFIRDVLAPVFRWLYQTVIVPVWNSIKSFISGAWSVIKTVFSAIRDFIHNVLAPAFRWFKDNVIVPVWNGIKRAIQVVWDGIKTIFNAIKSFMENVLAPAFRWLRDNVIKPVWDAIKRAIQVAWDGIKTIFNAIKQFLENTLGPVFRWLRDKVVKPVWDGIKKTISNVWTNGIKPVFDKLGKYVKETLPDLFRKGADAIGRVWSSVKNLLATPINWVIDNVINKGIVDTFNSVSSKLGLDAKLSRVGRIATAGKLDKTSNGSRLGKGKTSVGMYDVGGYTGPGHKYQAAGIVHAGEFVLRKEATNALMSTIGLKGLNHMNKTGQMPGFSDGGLVPELNPFKRLANSIGGKIREKFPRAGMVIDMLVGSAKKLAEGGMEWLKNKTKDMFTVKAPAGGGGPITSKNVGAIAPAAIRRLAEQALRREGVYSAANMASFLRRMHQESGFNPNAVNLWDANAKRGWPSQGLMQTIPPTFQTFRDKSLSNNIKDPFANMVAAIRYTKWRYGNVRAGWDKRGGYSSGGLVTPAKYDSGGWLQPGLQAVVNRTSKPEPILTNGQWQDISAIAQRGMTSGGDFYEINVPHLQATGDDVAQAIAYHSRINKRR